MALTLLLNRQGLGRMQPFDLGTMNVIEEAVAKLSPALADRVVRSCTEAGWRLPISSEWFVAFQPRIRSEETPGTGHKKSTRP